MDYRVSLAFGEVFSCLVDFERFFCDDKEKRDATKHNTEDRCTYHGK